MRVIDLFDEAGKIALAVECLTNVLFSEFLRDAVIALDLGGARRAEVPISIRNTRVRESILIGEVRMSEKIDTRNSLASPKSNIIIGLDLGGAKGVGVSISIRDTRVVESISIGEVRAGQK